MAKKVAVASELAIPRLDPLDKNFVLSKPLQQDRYELTEIYELERQGRLIITRKRDGWKLFAVYTKGRWKVYTDGMNEVHCLDHVKKDLMKLSVPDKTVLVGEGIVDVDGNDNFGKVGAIFQSDTAKALKLQSEVGFVKFMVFDIVIWGGKNYLNAQYRERLSKLGSLIRTQAKGVVDVTNYVFDANPDKAVKLDHVMPLTVLGLPFDEAQKLVRERHWEGLVLYDSDFVSSYRLDGKDPKRPDGCYKWKPLFTDEFIVRKWLPHLADATKVKEVAISQIDGTGREMDCGKFGLFDGKTREWLKTAKYPLVIEILFEHRFDSGKLRNARLVRFRDDKKPEGCRTDNVYPKAKYL